jgi:hypothetical protein
VNDSWDSARRHPGRTLAGLFGSGLIGVGLISYVGPGGGDIYLALVTGCASGLFLALLGRRAMRDGAESVARLRRPVTLFNALIAAAGVALVAWGVASADGGLALSGLPLVVLGLGLIGIRRLVAHRQQSG